MAIYKNVASQKLAVYAYDTSAGAAKTGDAANITAEISKDGAASAATNDANPTELDATDHPGIYIFDLTQAETNADLVIVSAVSSTSADISIEPVIAYTVPGTNAGVLAALADVAHGGSAATITAKGITVTATDAATAAVTLTGNTTGAGLKATGGTGGNGIHAVAGASGGQGINAEATAASAAGIYATSVGAGGYGLRAYGQGATSSGIAATGAASGFVVTASAGGGMTVVGTTGDIIADITGTLSGSVGSVTGHTAQTGDTYALANGATGFDAIDTVVDSILEDTGTTLPALLPAALVGGKIDANIGSIGASTAVITPWLAALQTIEVLTVGSGSTTTTVVTGAPANDTDDIYNGRLMAFYDSGDTQYREYARITNYDAASNTFTTTTMSTSPVSGDVVVII